jgi:hypothetical protein
MTFEYLAKRITKHLAQSAAKIPPETFPVAGAPVTIDLTPRGPSLGWLGGKLFKSSRGGNKNRSGYRPEQAHATIDNRNPYRGHDEKWFWMDDEGVPNDQSYVTREQAEVALMDYRDWVKKGKEVEGTQLQELKRSEIR